MTPNPEGAELPPLPAGRKMLSDLQSGVDIVYSEHQMRTYALAAVSKVTAERDALRARLDRVVFEGLNQEDRLIPSEHLRKALLQARAALKETPNA